MVILLFENLKRVIKDHQKDLRSTLQKLTRFGAFFLRLMNFPLSKLGNQIFIIDYQSVISKKGDFKTIGAQNLHMCESACGCANIFFGISHLEIRTGCLTYESKS